MMHVDCLQSGTITQLSEEADHPNMESFVHKLGP